MTKLKTITKKTSAIFLLSIVLVTGTFALSLSSPSSSFIIGEVQAQTADYGYKDKNGYNSEYPQDYGYDKKYYPPNKDPPADIVVPRDFDTIQEAINAADEGDVIKVLPGTYTEQLTISKSLTILGSGAKSTVIESPIKSLPLTGLQRNIINLPYIINIDNQAKVTIKGFTIKGLADTNCDTLLPVTDRLLGISVFGDATLKLDSAVIKDCTYRSVFIGTLLAPGQFGHATITNSLITDYQNAGVFAIGSDSTLTMSYNKVLGSPSDVDATFGIFFVNGAKGIITNNEVSGNKCKVTGPVPFTCGDDWINQVQSFGIDAALAGEGSVISKNYLFNNDIGIGVFEASGCCIIDRNKLTDNEVFGVAIADGEHTVSNTKIFGGGVGVIAAAVFENTVATLDGIKIVDAEIPVQALSSGDLTASVDVVSPYFLAP